MYFDLVELPTCLHIDKRRVNYLGDQCRYKHQGSSDTCIQRVWPKYRQISPKSHDPVKLVQSSVYNTTYLCVSYKGVGSFLFGGVLEPTSASVSPLGKQSIFHIKFFTWGFWLIRSLELVPGAEGVVAVMAIRARLIYA